MDDEDEDEHDPRDPAVLEGVKAITDRVHELLRETEEDGALCDQVLLRVPRAWLVLAAWLDSAERDRAAGHYRPAPLPVLELNEQHVRKLGKRWLRRHIEEEMHLQLHHLSAGAHWLLFPPEPDGEKPSGPLEDKDDVPL